MIDLTPIYLTLKLSFIVMILLAIIGIPLARIIAHKNSLFFQFLKTVISLPLILPPTVLGFYLLIFLNKGTFLGQLFETLIGESFLFSFSGLVFASMIYSLPFMINPILSGFESRNVKYTQMSKLYGISSFRTFIHIELPLIKNAVVTALIFTFAHTVGEFGVILMIGGNIPGATEVASIAIYKNVELLNYDLANSYALILLLISTVLIFITQLYKNKSNLI